MPNHKERTHREKQAIFRQVTELCHELERLVAKTAIHYPAGSYVVARVRVRSRTRPAAAIRTATLRLRVASQQLSSDLLLCGLACVAPGDRDWDFAGDRIMPAEGVYVLRWTEILTPLQEQSADVVDYDAAGAAPTKRRKTFLESLCQHHRVAKGKL